MQLYYPTRTFRVFLGHFIRGETARIGLDWTNLEGATTSAWVNEGRYTTLSGAELEDNVSTIYVTMTGVGQEVVQNTVRLGTGELVRQQFELRIIPGQAVEIPDPTCPVLLTPANNATLESLDSVTLTWAASTFATSYNVYLDGVLVVNTTGTSYEISDLDPDTSYTWKVNPVADGVEAASCGTRTFTTAELACPGLDIPVDGSAVGDEGSTTLLWSAVANAATYNVYVWENGDPQPGTPTTTTAGLTYEVTGLLPGTTYRWTVDAVSSEGYVSPGCNDSTFTTDAAPAIIEWQSATFTGDILGDEVTLVAVRSGNTNVIASADYTFTEGTALIGPDFIATPGTVTFAVGEVTKDVVVPLVRDYNAEILAQSSTLLGYWRLDEASPATSFDDLSASNVNLTLTQTGAALTYHQPTLNLDTGLSVQRNGSNSWRLFRNVNLLIDNGDSFTSKGWRKHVDTTPTAIKTLFHVGGAGGSGQFYYCWCYRNAAGNAAMSWHHQTGGGNTFVTKTFSGVSIPLGEEYFYRAGFDYSNSRAFFQLQGGTIEYVSWTGTASPGAGDSPNALNYSAGRQTFYYVGQRPVGNDGDSVRGQFSHDELHVGLATLDMWDRWNLDASLTFEATLSNPSVSAELGPIDETTMTIEAP